ncbi:hypothetical protein [Frankia sp. AgKG'84/4]|uniref:hypothetical protein n=1 Tax=Frankia sp. AgKG'84/4 TaxID=573490 RepID=UPI00200F9B2C|nr:hypothetical protein [Frankia sp. AgKG'84/4]MCL9797294.1 hypothetical protein [Frankia sp. AgKG'84/4]
MAQALGDQGDVDALSEVQYRSGGSSRSRSLTDLLAITGEHPGALRRAMSNEQCAGIPVVDGMVGCFRVGDPCFEVGPGQGRDGEWSLLLGPGIHDVALVEACTATASS